MEIRGEGPPLIFIHGLGCDHTQWNQEAARLSSAFQTIVFDCRGHGKSDKPVYYSLHDHIQDVLALTDYFALHDIILYGSSMGSYIAQGTAIAQSQRIHKLILVAPKSNGLTSSTQWLFQEHAGELKTMDKQEKRMFFYRHMVYDPQLLVEHPDLLKSTLTPKQKLAANKALAGFDFRKGLPGITARTLVISGKYDGLNPPAEGQICASLIPDSTFVEMQYSGHLPMYEEPDLYRSVIDRFLFQTK
ncbi:alpha/beta hydrolase fold protein [Syntrophobotulus glycolicus DSM 8271]|uniref:Alpha/beta hydrolase fold protein n=1 Tax=Syntrophobotulus glycolicus (strain DSM 8271 / FlGlyR) TaxID=645991 RepID=F0SZL3_SYNGF|nr:alpha/beta hydrolase fold protein [Syntrophobotulus glycolicus DSM 8271]